jgi:hypothetical protein
VVQPVLPKSVKECLGSGVRAKRAHPTASRILAGQFDNAPRQRMKAPGIQTFQQ